MCEHHYLGRCVPVGNVLRYVAEVQGRWVALLSWQSAALKCTARERWIGWSRVLQYQRLHLIANNSRFLVLPEARCPHLASRVLATCLKRLAQDWQAAFGHPVLLAETFVDPARFRGTCYAAANWQCVGHTRGFAKSGGTYVEHGRPKTVWLYPLHRKTRAWLCDPVPHPKWSHAMSPVILSNAQMDDLCLYLRTRIPDHRRAAGRRHPLTTLLTIAAAAVLAGARSFEAIAQWGQRLSQAQLKRVRAYCHPKTRRFEAPSEPTLRRMLTHVDAEATDRAVGEWLAARAGTGPIVIDGKTLKGARRDDGSQVHLLSAMLAHEGITLAQCEVSAKTNEIPELRKLVEPLTLTHRVVMADALHTQKETARYLVEDKGADYVFTVKENQPTLYDAIHTLEPRHFPPVRDAYGQGPRAGGNPAPAGHDGPQRLSALPPCRPGDEAGAHRHAAEDEQNHH